MTENCPIASTMELLGFTWVLRGNFTFTNPMMPMSFKGQNQEVLLSGSKEIKNIFNLELNYLQILINNHLHNDQIK